MTAKYVWSHNDFDDLVKKEVKRTEELKGVCIGTVSATKMMTDFWKDNNLHLTDFFCPPTRKKWKKNGGLF